MNKKIFTVAQLIGDSAFISKVENAINGLIPESFSSVTVDAIGLGEVVYDSVESFIVNAKVDGQTLSFRSAINRETGELVNGLIGLTASTEGFNWQYDCITNRLVGGISDDGGTYFPDFCLSGVSVADVQDAIKYCESKAMQNEDVKIVGEWQYLKNA